MTCPYQSTPRARYYSHNELVEIIKQYQPFIRGITVSGGEATLYHEFLTELFKSVKQLGLSCYIDTNGFFKYNKLVDLIDQTDYFLYDVKAFDNLSNICGINSRGPFDNLKRLLSLDKVAEVRTVLLNEFVDCEKTVDQVSKLLSAYDVTYRLIKPHLQGLKTEQIKKIQAFIPSDQKLEELRKIAEKNGFNNIELSDFII